MGKLHGLLDTLTAKHVLDRTSAIFHYSSYWGKWSRTLVAPKRINPTLSGEYGYVELNLTPINPNDPGVWDSIRQITFRAHCTPPWHGDKDVAFLPTNVHECMVKELGEELTQRLLTEDFLSQIDLDLLHAAPGGGTPLHRILKK